MEKQEKYSKTKEEKDCTTLNDFIALGTRRGYKNPRFWAMKKMDGRKAREKVKTTEATALYNYYDRGSNVNYGYAE